MASVTQIDELPLRSKTPDCWAAEAVRDMHALLNDHAYLEKKAATNALELLTRWPEPACPADWTTTLAAIAADEAAHLNSVLRLMARRDARLERTHRSSYANALRTLVRRGRGNEELVDRLLVSALIEARSCERFDILSRCCPDRQLASFYRRLGASEFGHYRVFLRLAGHAATEQAIRDRWDQWLDSEARILAEQPRGSRLHGAG